MVSYEKIKDLFELGDLNFLGKYILTFSEIYYKHSDDYDSLDEVVNDFQEEVNIGLNKTNVLKKNLLLSRLLEMSNSNYVIYSFYEGSEHISNPFYFESKDNFEKLEFEICRDLELLKKLGFNMNYLMN